MSIGLIVVEISNVDQNGDRPTGARIIDPACATWSACDIYCVCAIVNTYAP